MRYRLIGRDPDFLLGDDTLSGKSFSWSFSITLFLLLIFHALWLKILLICISVIVCALKFWKTYYKKIAIAQVTLYLFIVCLAAIAI
jgi:hypothetical protein